MMRDTAPVAPPPTKMPRCPSGMWNCIPASTTRTWEAAAISSPPPITATEHSETTGTPPNWMRSITECQWREWRNTASAGAHRLTQIEPGGEVAAGAGKDDDPDASEEAPKNASRASTVRH